LAAVVAKSFVLAVARVSLSALKFRPGAVHNDRGIGVTGSAVISLAK
jgi:hypothetical protein